MKRWDFTQMQEIGQRLFAKIYKQKLLAHHNHDAHFLAREIDVWFPDGIQAMQEGRYSPQHPRRFFLQDEVFDQLHVSDRIFQHILLKQLKPTFTHVMNANCFHLIGPSDVKQATQRVRVALQTVKPNIVIRADIKSFYRSIPIETSRGCQNASHGIALRGPLSQLFSGIYLKPFDDAFNLMDVSYVRYQDVILILCRTKRQLNRCKRRMMEVLQERRLQLSRKKSRMGCIQKGFHFLGIHYPGTQPQDNTALLQNQNLTRMKQFISLSINQIIRNFITVYLIKNKRDNDDMIDRKIFAGTITCLGYKTQRSVYTAAQK